MEDQLNTVVPSVLAVVLSLVTIIYTVLKNKAEVRKLNFEGDSTLASATDEVAESVNLLLNPLNAQITLLRNEVEKLREENVHQNEEAEKRILLREKEIERLEEYIQQCVASRAQTILMLDELREIIETARAAIADGDIKK